MPARAAGPEAVARSNRSLWPHALDSTIAYNRASRAEILAFTAALARVTELGESGLRTELHIESPDLASVKRVRNRLVDRLLQNYRAAQKSCGPDEPFCASVQSAPELFQAADKLAMSAPAPYRQWLTNAQQFHRIYAQEQVRLAALFPKISSEIDRFDDKERNGFELPDGHFQLTFDDGPSDRAGSTDTLLKTLEQQGIHGTFYVVGTNLQARLQVETREQLRERYQGQCVALHGWNHVSHQKSENWQKSVLDVQQLVQQVFLTQYRPWFRPPYGQRRADGGSFFQEHGLTVALWNIDSQDWNGTLRADEAANRVLTLMLLWRRGVVLFHDVNQKANTAVPWLVGQTRQAGIVWEDCRDQDNRAGK
ncbi:MAG TPA: polysaccharide deacetylase family protein [Polyangium sp.]|nr:polysaccharide deacetylase family protein [Polyangium sp.]